MFLLAKQVEASPESSIAEILGWGFVVFLLILIVVSVRILMECVRHRYANPVLMGVLMLGSSVGPILLILAAMYGVVEKEDWMVIAPPAGIAVWFVALVIYTVFSHIEKKKVDVREHEQEVAKRQSELNSWGTVDPDLAEPADVPNVVPLDEAAAGPRRAVSLPANESDGSGRPSEQTIKRMTAAQIEKGESEVKGPRADEVAGNPILADGEAKIRCLACDKKMKADAMKFRKQRRCPACKAEPFRYVTAV